jgi:hypothetical protein
MKLVSGASSINQFLIWQLCDFTVYLVILLLRDASSKLIDVLFLLVWLYRYAFHSTNRMSDDEKPRPFFVPVAPLRIIIFGSEIPLEIWGESTRWVFLFFLDRSILSLLLMVIRGINFRGFYAFPRISVDTNCWTTKNQIVTAVFSIQCFIHVLIGRSNGHICAWASACSFVWIFGSLFYISPFEKILASERDLSLEKFTDW